jgi:hypothetical protein
LERILKYQHIWEARPRPISKPAMPPCPSTFPLFPQPEHLNTIYLSRHGESLNNLYGRIGGDKGLSERGQKYAKELSNFVNSLKLPGFKVKLLPTL